MSYIGHCNRAKTNAPRICTQTTKHAQPPPCLIEVLKIAPEVPDVAKTHNTNRTPQQSTTVPRGETAAHATNDGRSRLT